MTIDSAKAMALTLWSAAGLTVIEVTPTMEWIANVNAFLEAGVKITLIIGTGVGTFYTIKNGIAKGRKKKKRKKS